MENKKEVNNEQKQDVQVYQYSQGAIKRVSDLLNALSVTGYQNAQILVAIGDIINRPIGEDTVKIDTK